MSDTQPATEADVVEAMAKAIRKCLYPLPEKTWEAKDALHAAQRAGVLLPAEAAALREALRRLAYEATHCSPEREDGSRSCIISRAALSEARAALAQPVKEATDE